MGERGGEQEGPRKTAGFAADAKFALHMMRQNPLVIAGLVVSVASVLIALLAGFIVNPAAWQHTDLSVRLCWNNPITNWGITNIFNCGGPVYPLGTDSYGRDLLQMIILAIPLDLEIALEVVAFSVLMGVVLGGIAAYAGGVIDEVILRVTDIFLAVPAIILAIVLLVILGRSFAILTAAVAITWWPTYVRLVRSQVLAEKEKPYVESLRAMGAGWARILFRHIVVNSIYPVLVEATLDIGNVILTVSALTFIGFAPNPAIPELGNLANDGIKYIFTAPWLIIFSGLTILIISLGFNLLGDGIRDVFDPRLRR
jgi:peptide/nickel transport system permease protein